MTGLTSRWDLPYPEGTDLARDLDDALEALALRLDYLQGEIGVWASPATVAVHSAVINLSRSYPDGFYVICQCRNSTGRTSAVTMEAWGNAESIAGGPGGVSQFTINLANPTASSKSVVYKVFPLPAP